MKTLTNDPSTTFRRIFSTKNIEKVYKDDIAYKNIRGIDRMTTAQFQSKKKEHFEVIQRKCLTGEYRFAPYAERLRLRGRGRCPRVISVATIRDRIVLSLLKEYLHEVFHECVNRKLPNNYISDIRTFYDTDPTKDFCLYKLDIESFYDTIDHQKLLAILKGKISSKPDLILVKRAIETPTVPTDHKSKGRDLTKHMIGVPQGLAISNILANIYLYRFDDKIRAKSKLYKRYVDDMLIIVPPTEEKAIKQLVYRSLRQLGLKRNKDKTLCVPLNTNIEYLGYELMLPKVSVRQSTVERYLRSISSIFSEYSRLGPAGMYPGVTSRVAQKLFLSDLNEKITGAISEKKRYGWIFYFLEMNNMALIYHIETIIRNRFLRRLKPEIRPQIAEIKKLSRVYYEAKHHPLGGYIHNYDQYDTIPKQLEFIRWRGLTKKGERLTIKEIKRRFNAFRKSHISHLEADIGETS